MLKTTQVSLEGVDPTLLSPHHRGAKDVAFGKYMDSKRVHTFYEMLVCTKLHATFKLIDILINTEFENTRAKAKA